MVLDVLIVHFNTPELTQALVKSIRKFSRKEVRINVFDNSDKRPFPPMDGVRIIDNTKGQLIDFNRFLAGYPERFGDVERKNDWGSAKHSKTIDYCFDLFPDGFILMDSDILLKQDYTWMADTRFAWSGWRRVYKTPYGYKERVWPFLCWINVPMLREHGIRYFNSEHMWKLMPGPGAYDDTGAWLLQATLAAGLRGMEVYIEDYMVHYGSASWGTTQSQQDNQEEWLEKYSKLWK